MDCFSYLEMKTFYENLQWHSYIQIVKSVESCLFLCFTREFCELSGIAIVSHRVGENLVTVFIKTDEQSNSLELLKK